MSQVSDGWIEWKGGDFCPVAENALVEFRLRDGREDTDGSEAGLLIWRHGKHQDFDSDLMHHPENDIIAYRVVAPPIETELTGGKPAPIDGE